MGPKLPLDVILSVAEFLDAKDLLFFRIINRAVYDQIEVNLSIWRRLAWDAVQLFPRAPHTFDISSMSAADAKALALRPYRLEHLLLHPRDDYGRLEISMSPLAPESVHRLKKPEGSYFNMYYTLPGNRWLYTILSWENNEYQLSLWDLHSPIKAEGTEPVCSVQIKQPHQPILFPPKAYPQLDKDHDAVNFLIYYGTMGSSGETHIFEVHNLSWNEGLPAFVLKESYEESVTANELWDVWIDGDYVCILRYNGLLLWKWSEGTRGFVSINRSIAGPRPLLFQPPYMIPRKSPMPKLFVLDLESMSSSSVVPTLSMEPAEMTVLGDMDDDDGVQPKAFGQRWSLPSSDTPGAPRQDLLLSETLNYRTGDAGFLALTWSHSTRTLKCWPLVPHNVRNYEERLILPSGALLLDCSSSPILHNPAVAKEGEQSIKGSAFDFRIYRTNTNPTTLGIVSLVVPHPETITISYSNWATPYLCPVSGTIVILLRGGGDSDMFQVGVSRAVGLP